MGSHEIFNNGPTAGKGAEERLRGNRGLAGEGNGVGGGGGGGGLPGALANQFLVLGEEGLEAREEVGDLGEEFGVLHFELDDFGLELGEVFLELGAFLGAALGGGLGEGVELFFGVEVDLDAGEGLALLGQAVLVVLDGLAEGDVGGVGEVAFAEQVGVGGDDFLFEVDELGGLFLEAIFLVSDGLAPVAVKLGHGGEQVDPGQQSERHEDGQDLSGEGHRTSPRDKGEWLRRGRFGEGR